MKVIQVLSYYPPHLGGLENVAREISEKLASKGHKVEVYTSNIGCRGPIIQPVKNLKINYLKGWEFAHSVFIPTLFFRLLKVPKDSIMHIHTGQIFVPEVAYLVSKLIKVPYIIHFHADVRLSGKLGILLPLYKNIFLKRVLKSAHKIIVLDKKYEVLLNHNYGIYNNIAVIPNGVSDSFFVEKATLSSKYTNLLFVGRLSVVKNVPKLIKATTFLKNNVILHIVGDGEKMREIEILITEGNLSNIIIYGKKTGENLIGFYKNADIFLLASDYEGLPLVLLEAMASGTPIIASDVIGIRELVENTGILVNPPTPENFAKAIDGLIENKSLQNTLSKMGRDKAKNYSWDAIIEKIEDIYRDVLNETH